MEEAIWIEASRMGEIRRLAYKQNRRSLTLRTLYPLENILPLDLQVGPLNGPTFSKWLNGNKIFCYFTDVGKSPMTIPLKLEGKVVPTDNEDKYEVDRAFYFQIEAVGGKYKLTFIQPEKEANG